MELQRYKEKGEKIDIEFVAYGAGLNMMRNDNSPLKERLAAQHGAQRGQPVKAGEEGDLAGSRGADCPDGDRAHCRTRRTGLDLCTPLARDWRQQSTVSPEPTTAPIKPAPFLNGRNPVAQGSIWEAIHMRTTLLTSATLLVVVVTAPALSQPTVTPPTAPGSSVTSGYEKIAARSAAWNRAYPGNVASERIPSDTAGQPVWSKLRPHEGVQRRSPAAPRSATASIDENASADQYLRDAQTALRERRTREAQEALERAEIRVLNSAPNTNAGKNSTVNMIEQAREALGHVRYLRPDLARGGQMIDQAMSETASKGTSSLSGGQSGSTNGTNGSAGSSPITLIGAVAAPPP